jgi:hypothetical protein
MLRQAGFEVTEEALEDDLKGALKPILEEVQRLKQTQDYVVQDGSVFYVVLRQECEKSFREWVR